MGCSNKTVTNLSGYFRQIDLLDKNNKVVKTYYQSFNNQIYEWINISCEFAKKNFKKIDDCKFTEITKLNLKKNKEGVSPQISNNVVSNSNTLISGNNNQGNNQPTNQPNNTKEPAEENFNNPPQENMGQEFENCDDPQRC